MKSVLEDFNQKEYEQQLIDEARAEAYAEARAETRIESYREVLRGTIAYLKNKKYSFKSALKEIRAMGYNEGDISDEEIKKMYK